MEKLLLQFEGLEQAFGLIIGLLGFIVFILLGSLAKKRNGLFFTIAGAFAFVAVFVVCHEHPMFSWLYGDDKVTNFILTLVIVPIYILLFSICCYFNGRLMDYLVEMYKASKLGVSLEKYREIKEVSKQKTMAELKQMVNEEKI